MSAVRANRFAGLAALLVLGVALGARLRMHEGLVLSNDVKSRFWPWAPSLGAPKLEAPALSDPVWQFVPWLELARREIAAGRLPFWNPYQDGGVPLLGNSISSLGSPLVWPALLFGVRPGWNLSLLLRALLAAAAAYLWLRDRGRSHPAAALGALAFALSSSFIAWLEHPQTLSAAAVPLLLLFGGRLAERPTRGDFAGLVAATFVVLSGGHPETVLMAALLAAAYAAFRGGTLVALRWPAAAGFLGAALAAPLLLPFFEYYASSAARLGEGRSPFVLPLTALRRFILPDDPHSHQIEGAAAVSLAVLLLVPFGLRGLRRESERGFWAGSALILLGVAYGGPLARALADATNLYLSRVLLLLPLAFGFLAAAGLDDLISRAESAGRAGAARACAGALTGLAALELLVFAGHVHAVTKAPVLTPITPLLARLREEAGLSRVLPLHSFLPANTATDLQLEDVRGYDALAPRAWRVRREDIGRFRDLPNVRDVVEPWDLAPGGAALDAWSVKYLLLHPQFAFGAPELNARLGLDLMEVYSGPDGRILVNRRARPRVRLEGAPGKTLLVGRTATRWTIRTESSAPARLVVANPMFPGWRAKVDGAPSRIESKAGELTRVPVPAGNHEVVLQYRPSSFSLSLAVALLGAIFTVAVMRFLRSA
ncbi:MAG TPA: YfhO family protein [Thermoanaerobaculia bacterium]|nr:YfhO family protein [Thermoanaerobaculia bacterium]